VNSGARLGEERWIHVWSKSMRSIAPVSREERAFGFIRHSTCLLIWAPHFVLNSNMISSVDIGTRLRTARLRNRGLIPAVCSTQPPPIQCILGVMWQGREADNSPPSNAEIKNSGAIAPLPHTSSWRGPQG
jgi:hypothetical protein